MNFGRRSLAFFLLTASCLLAIAQEEVPTGKSGRAPATMPSAETFVYRVAKPEPMRVYIFKPKGWKAGDRRPALIHFFGGGFVRGLPTQAAGWARQAAALGMIGVAADYRVRDRHGTDGTACIADARAAIHWLQVHATELGLDPKQIVASGSSAGGHLALWTAITASPPGSDPAEAPLEKPAALILMWPAADFTFYSAKQDRFGGHALDCSATQHLDPKMPPSLLLHGDQDPTVPHESSVVLHQKLSASGNRCEFITMTGCGHGTTLPEWKAKLPGLMRQFLTAQGILPVKTAGTDK